MFNLDHIAAEFRDAATNLVTLAAGAEASIHKMETDDPLVADAIRLAEDRVPGLSQVVGAAQMVLLGAQAMVTTAQQQAQAAPPPPAPPPAPSVAGAAP